MFSNELIALCKFLNIPLQTECPNNEKAFVCAKKGKVLGIIFDTEFLTWKLPDEKYFKYLNFVFDLLKSKRATLKQMQSLLGILNNICLMATFLRGFKFNLNSFLKQLHANDVTTVIPDNVFIDLQIFANFLAQGNLWRPIVPKYYYPPLSFVNVTTDASGKYSEENTGCGHIITDQDDYVMSVFQYFWPNNEFLLEKDADGHVFSNKTCSLEFIGILIPFLLTPELLSGKHVVVNVDNIACCFGWINRQIPNDECASMMVRALHVISAYISCIVHIEHLPRLSTGHACLVDRLSRESTTTAGDRELLDSFHHDVSRLRQLEFWLKNPREDWLLPNKLFLAVKNSLTK
jgi:hypothetical protein